jgi:hypothetical protein
MICAVCCGSRREVDIDCPSSCSYLRAGRAYESETRSVDPGLVDRVRAQGRDFIERFNTILVELGVAAAEERDRAPWLVDTDVIEVYKALQDTMRTLTSGIYYESLPEGATRIALFRRLKAELDRAMSPNEEGARVLRPSEAVQILDLLILVATTNSNVRPRSRQYLDLLSEQMKLAKPSDPGSRLILP